MTHDPRVVAPAITTSLASVVRALRERALLSQEELAERSGLSVGTISGLEAGRIHRPRATSIRMLADGLGLSETERAAVVAATRGGRPVRNTVAGTVSQKLPSPAQLPAIAAGFTGRAEAFRALDEALGIGASPPGSPVAIAAIDGMAGVGKTALAVQWAHRMRQHFPDGQLYVNLRGYGPDIGPMEPLAALTSFLHAFGVAGQQVPANEDGASAMYRSVLADKRVLVVLDNAANADQVRPLLPGGHGSGVLVTSRAQLGGLIATHGARRVCLDVLPDGEACALLARVLGDARVQAEPEAVIALARLCGYLPLALRIAAANVVAHPTRPITEYLTRLRESDRLKALAVQGDPHDALDAAFDLSYSRLPDAARRLFRLFGLVPGPDITVDAAASLAGTTVQRVAPLLDVLTNAHLMEEQASGRYTCHDLLRVFAAARGLSEEAAPERDAARTRLYDFYLDGADAAAQAAYPQGLRLPLEHPRHESSMRDPLAALAWLDAERANLVAAVTEAASHGLHRWAWGIADSLRGYFWIRLHAPEWMATANSALDAARSAGDMRAQAAANLNLTCLYLRLSRYPPAVDHGLAALRFARAGDWIEGEASALANLGCTYSRVGKMRAGIACLLDALALCEKAGWKHGRAVALNNLGSIHIEAGLLHEADRYVQRALSVNVDLGLRSGQVVCLNNLGTIHYTSARFPLAHDTLTQALHMGQAIGSSTGVCCAQNWLALVHLAAGHHERAEEAAAAAIDLAHRTGQLPFEANGLNALGAVRLCQGRPEEAIESYRRAEEVVVSPEVCAHAAVEAYVGLAAARLRLGEHGRAREHVLHALAEARRAGFRVLEGKALTVLTALHLAQGQTECAARTGRDALTVHRETGHLLAESRTHSILSAEPTRRPHISMAVY